MPGETFEVEDCDHVLWPLVEASNGNMAAVSTFSASSHIWPGVLA